ncbi:MAG: deoxyguanosinetriphosphate triphosphohydrolase [Oscillospiraceae bacterium]|jgi:dGTPase|nr:deoxyguanosinetriphosphate triphosphohydrolase [Oscillospiraceae bacterium]
METQHTPGDLRNRFQRDADRIVHSKSFRRLMHKTQVFLMPEGDHYRTRMTHALEVSRIARTMARALSLNEDLTEAIALGHDLGHPPFGHAGERALNAILPFTHNEQSLRVVERLEKDGAGLGLSPEVREGIRHHSGGTLSASQEGMLVRCADRIAYLSHDMDDAVRAGLLSLTDVPADLRADLGDTPRERINTFVNDLVQESRAAGTVRQSPARKAAMDGLRAFMTENVYFNPRAKGEEVKVPECVGLLFEHFLAHYRDVPETLRRIAEEDGAPRERAVCDYIAGMTDRFFEAKFMETLIPRGWKNI